MQSKYYPNIATYVCDDDPTGNTIFLLQEYQAYYSNVKLATGENVGYIRSFYNLVHTYGGNDSEIEALITKTIKSLSGIKTMIIIARRLSTIKHYNHIYALENGQITKSGSYQEVVLSG